MDAQTTAIVKATAPALEVHAESITQHMYPLMFKRYPEVKTFFNQTHQSSGTQPKALANGLIAYAKHIDDLGQLSDAVRLIVHKHCALGIEPAHYAIVGECILEAIGAVLGDAATEEVVAAWAKAYQSLADILINAEAQLYAENAKRAGGWQGQKAFKVVKKIPESEVITSFYLQSETPELIDFSAGQYTTVVLNINGQSLRRNYSLSQAPSKDTLRISVKKEKNGVVSSYLHDQIQEGDTLQLLPPCGDFVLKNTDKPLVLISGGVGITPTISMLESAASTERPIVFLHAAINGNTHAFKDHVDGLANQYPNVHQHYIYSAPNPEDAPHSSGFVNQALLEELLPKDRDVDVYFLGPKTFMSQTLANLKALEIPESQIHYEFFGPLETL